VLGHGDVTGKLFVVADAFTGSARQKIEAAGGFVQLLNPPAEGAQTDADQADEDETAAEPTVDAETTATVPTAAEPAPEARTEPEAKPARARSAKKDAQV
jgi:hypothetical protein